MPLYEYNCPKCELMFEALVFNGEEAECPQCHSRKLDRLLSLPAKPKTADASLPMACNASGPPCGPVCSRFQ